MYKHTPFTLERKNDMSNSNFRTGRHVVYDLNAHIVLTPKYRKK